MVLGILARTESIENDTVVGVEVLIVSIYDTAFRYKHHIFLDECTEIYFNLHSPNFEHIYVLPEVHKYFSIKCKSTYIFKYQIIGIQM